MTEDATGRSGAPAPDTGGAGADPAPDPRQGAILTAAFGIFARYGYRKTSMDDIAREAGMSRPALYQYFRNKEDIFRSMVAAYFDAAIADVAAALERPGPPDQTLAAAFAARDGAVMEMLMTSPHGAELLDAGLSVSADLIHAKEAEICALLAGWLRRRGAAGELSPAVAGADPQALAETIMDALKGIKRPELGPEVYAARRSQLAHLFGRALAV